jgi:hypothetical protein
MAGTQFESDNSKISINSDIPKSPVVARTHQVNKTALAAAEAFYPKYKQACLGFRRRYDLERLYYATFHTFANMDFDSSSKKCPSFNRVLIEMEETMGVVRNPSYGSLEWTEKPSFSLDPEMNRHDPSRDVVREYRINQHRIGIETTLFAYDGHYCGSFYGDRRGHWQPKQWTFEKGNGDD